MQLNKLEFMRGIFFFVVAVSLALAGCAEIELLNPEDVVKHPLGTETIKVGMTKQEVESLWGKPDEVSFMENKEKWKGPREVWTYRAHYGAVPVDAGYLSKTKKLYFDGNNLTNIGE